ncbi:MAG: twin-arginine translocase subunit TatC [Alphaproteobacteria bacterium]
MTTADPEKDDLESSRAPLLEHLLELRSRLIWSLAVFAATFVLCYVFADDLYRFLTQPLLQVFEEGKGEEGRRLIFTALQETFFTYVRLAAFGALCLSFPFLASQIWLFIAPGLYRNERKAFLPFLVATPILFAAGAALAYYVVIPLAIDFFVSFEAPGGEDRLAIELEAKVSEYLGLIMTLMFAFGVGFLLPVLLTLLGRAGIVSASDLRRQRKFAIVGIFAAAMFLTPPDPLSQVGLALPLLLLYEISVWSVAMMERKRAEREAAED